MVPLGRAGRAEDVAAAVAFLAGPDAAYITGVNLLVDGGFLQTVLEQIPWSPDGVITS
jgi:NAD(P)-dependent dehydrogenase (short-subunit alcohol dehydrogenase family)